MHDLRKIEEMAIGIETHLHKLEGCMSQMRDIKSSLELMRDMIVAMALFDYKSMKRDVADLSETLKRYGLPQSNTYERDLKELRDSIESTEWPVAVDAAEICYTDEAIEERADSILDLEIGERLDGKRFLDYGCGTGHTIRSAENRKVAVSVGFDVNPTKFSPTIPNLTNSFETVQQKGPYDVILMHDVLDHIVVIDPIEALKQAVSVLAPGGRIYIKNHPWCCRHGGHLYQKKNKAFLHLVLEETELVRFGGIASDCANHLKIPQPIETYEHWFSQAGLRIVDRQVQKQPVEPFFLKESVHLERLRKIWPDQSKMAEAMAVNFVQYTLEADTAVNHLIF